MRYSKPHARIRMTGDLIVFAVIKYTAVTLTALICLVPFYMLAVSSFTSEQVIITQGYSFIPRPGSFSLSAYGMVFRNPLRILRAYRNSVFITLSGTVLSLLFSSMGAYTLFSKKLKYRNKLAFFLYFTTLFNGGLLAYYLTITRYLHLQNTYWVMLLSPMFNVMYILILRNFINASIPQALIDAAKIDGAGDFRIYWQLVLPLSKPALASIGLFIALHYWNDWWTPMMFVERSNLHPLQYTLYQILSSVNFAASMVDSVPQINLPKESLKLAMTVVATGPIV
ncbi:MAG: carbohydrate ABC transporter permease, partial [Treponema sp.]|nr:carbohydrate ABC transporter permease [Treponema sp.]